jgi:acetyl esterase/lipase
MPIGYLITTAGTAAAAVAAVLRRQPRRSSPFRVTYIFGLWLNWPLLTFALLVASTALAIAQTGVDSPGLWVGLALAAVASAALVALRRRARGTGPVLERALGDGLGADWRDNADSARLRRRPSLARVLWAPVLSRRLGVERIANVRYGPARRANLIDLYRNRSGPLGRPVLIHLHPLFGSKRVGTRHLFHRLAAAGWICVAANYRRVSDGERSDVEAVIAWVREHGPEYGADPNALFLAGSSLGAGLASRAACADAGVAGVICLYGYYGHIGTDATANAPPWFVAHGDQDSLVRVDDARGFVEQLRATSPNAVVYAELPGAQHGFDLFRSRRFDTVVDAIEAFTTYVRRSAIARA